MTETKRARLGALYARPDRQAALPEILALEEEIEREDAGARGFAWIARDVHRAVEGDVPRGARLVATGQYRGGNVAYPNGRKAFMEVASPWVERREPAPADWDTKAAHQSYALVRSDPTARA